MRNIRHFSTLFYYDGPQVFEAGDAAGRRYLAAVSPLRGFCSATALQMVGCGATLGSEELTRTCRYTINQGGTPRQHDRTRCRRLHIEVTA